MLQNRYLGSIFTSLINQNSYIMSIPQELANMQLQIDKLIIISQTCGPSVAKQVGQLNQKMEKLALNLDEDQIDEAANHYNTTVKNSRLFS